MKKFLSCTLLLPLLLGSCHDASEHLPANGESMVKAELSDYNNGGGPASSETTVKGLAGYHFENGVLTHIYDSFLPSGNGCNLAVNNLNGTLYAVAWADEPIVYERPDIGTAESDWLRTPVEGMNLFFSGSMKLADAAAGAASIVLRRGLARFDLLTEVAGEVHISKASIQNAWLTGWMFPQEEWAPASDAATGEVELNGHAYLHEQTNPNLKVAVDAIIDGREYHLEAALPSEVRRNTRYSVTLRKDAHSQEVSLSVIAWADGGTSDARPDRNEALRIDTKRSNLPSGAILSSDGRTITLPHAAADFTIGIAGDEQIELVSADGYLLDVAPLPAGSTAEMNLFRIRKSLYAPGVEGTDAVMQFRRKSLSNVYPDDRIVLRLLPNPTIVTGPMNFDTDHYEHDFGCYVDNELGVFTLPEGSDIAVEYAAGEDAWLKLEPAEGRSWRVLGGWRPNDPTANGREQKAVIVVTQGETREEYTVSRRNYGLPVVWLQGIWWCKYNAMGRSTHFDDQILSADDPAAAAGVSVYDYLQTCTPDEYRRLWQWAYQGSSGEGMKVAEENSVLVMEGFSMNVADHINRLPADALAPDGYELPSMDDFNKVFDATDYVWLMWNGTHTLKNAWEGHSLIQREQRRKNGLTVGGQTLDDLIYIAMWSPDYPEQEPVVWYGPGAQWNADGIKHAGHYNNILFGVHSPAGEGWYMAGAMNAFYLHKNGAGNRDTRILRFKKSDVEYIY